MFRQNLIKNYQKNYQKKVDFEKDTTTTKKECISPEERQQIIDELR